MPHIHELYDFTASAFILHPNEPKLLLLKHTKIGKWLQPGGHIELDENPLQALQRELQEETGLLPADYTILEPAAQPQPTDGKTTVLPLPFHINTHFFDPKKSHQHIDLTYLARAKTDVLTDHPDGADAIGWFTLSEIKSFYDKEELFTDTLQISEWIFAKSSN